MVLFGLFVLLLAAVAWFITEAHLSGDNLDRYDGGKRTPINADSPPSAAHHEVVGEMASFVSADSLPSGGSRLSAIRNAMDTMGDAADLENLTRIETVAEGVPAEWIFAPNADTSQRLLYIHGGAFTAGSPRSHRPITTALARRLGIAVLAIDYRLMPEASRQDGIDDCRRAYRWIHTHGPGNYHRARRVFVAGDSAGGNLTLSLLSWIRDVGAPPVDAAVALSPATDATFSSPSLRSNLETDPMLGPPLKRVVEAPNALLLWFAWLSAKISPAHPSVSPVRGDLQGLAPTLIHVSEAEILRDDAYRYYYKALEAGSPVTLESWEHMVHVWHIFEPRLPEAHQALDHISRFLQPYLLSVPAAPEPAAMAAG
ncbi:MAG: alpha/beta hydrolase [Pseudomonadota bacterium]